MIRARFVPPAFQTLRCSEVPSHFRTVRNIARLAGPAADHTLDLNEALTIVVGRAQHLAFIVQDLVHRSRVEPTSSREQRETSGEQ